MQVSCFPFWLDESWWCWSWGDIQVCRRSMPFNLSFLFRFESLRKHLVLEGRMCILNVNSSKLLQMWANWMLSQFRNREIPYRQNVTTALNQGYNVRHAHVFHCASSFGDSLSCRTLHIWCGRCYISWGRESGDKEEGPEPIACGLRILKREETQKELQEWQMSRRLFFFGALSTSHKTVSDYVCWPSVFQDFLHAWGGLGSGHDATNRPETC